jgi:hypothetical protein
MKWLDEDFELGYQATQHCTHFAWACSLTIDGVVY